MLKASALPLVILCSLVAIKVPAIGFDHHLSRRWAIHDRHHLTIEGNICTVYIRAVKGHFMYSPAVIPLLSLVAIPTPTSELVLL